ncbi:unnamed protein product [Arctia plantaginis]|uniref:Integrin beta epidermal growth factor-like domain-containing protein n=1 Tax=Arctia plantaginis TaxID=874455 RepID=A0A8S0ZS16_ARCPL|nr:unnamed protein product [Arctia plantaginis]
MLRRAYRHSQGPIGWLSHCSWCPTEKICFSRQLETFKTFCSNDTVNHEDYGLSLEGNAVCSCNREEIEENCYPPGVTSGPVCSSRGSCVCGQCMCNTVPDPKEPTKTVMGEFCEYDNFSCEGPRCNEGPYSISAPNGVEDGSARALEVEIPAT